MRPCRGLALGVALALLIVAFAADTATTLAGGAPMRARDLNPLIRGLSRQGYLLWSAARLAVAAALLVLAWPRHLELRGWIARRGRWAALLIPFAYERPLTYMLPWLLIAVGPLKLAAATANLYLLQMGAPVAGSALIVSAGVVLGMGAGNLVLFRAHRTALP